ncbi:MAG: hypothetical protein LBF01_03905 [Bacteroidales bacterium]|nr:hypothetical protein [Bacteroidales bacterium]
MQDKKYIICVVFLCIAALNTVAALNINTTSAQQTETSTFQPSPVTVSPYYDTDGNKYYRVHIVEKGQTLYSVARAYRCAISDIIKKSPQGDNTISIGEPLRIPLFDRKLVSSLKRYNVEDTLIKHAEAEAKSEAETEYQQSKRQGRKQQRQRQQQEQLSQLQEEQPQEQQEESPLAYHPIEPQPPKDIINISLMLPLYANDTSFPKKQYYFLPILQGVLLAMEEIDKHASPKIKVNVFDLTEDEDLWNDVKNNPKFLESDIILCAAYRNIFPRLDTFSQKNHVPLVHLHSERDSLCFGNPYFIQLLPSQFTQIEILADSLVKNFSHSNFIVFVEDIAVSDKLQAAQQLYDLLEKAKNENFFNPQYIHLYNPNQEGYEKFSNLLDNKNSNVVCGFARQEIQLANMFVPLLKNDADKEKGMLINDYSISLFGPATWAYFSKIDPELFYRTSFTYFNTFATKLDKYESRVFEKKFYDSYGALPDGMAYKGYVFSKWLFEALQQYNINFISNLKECNEYSIMGMRFNFMPSLGGFNGYENRSIEFVRFFE